MNIPPTKLYSKDSSQKFRLPKFVTQKTEIEVLNLKVPINEISLLNTKNGIFPGYHLNKKYWITVLLEDILPDERIMELVNESYTITLSLK